jgi:hypothetical protein
MPLYGVFMPKYLIKAVLSSYDTDNFLLYSEPGNIQCSSEGKCLCQIEKTINAKDEKTAIAIFEKDLPDGVSIDYINVKPTEIESSDTLTEWDDALKIGWHDSKERAKPDIVPDEVNDPETDIKYLKEILTREIDILSADFHKARSTSESYFSVNNYIPEQIRDRHFDYANAVRMESEFIQERINCLRKVLSYVSRGENE